MPDDPPVHGWRSPGPWLHLLGVLGLAFLFAQVEVQIEGGQGWAVGLPVTFRVVDHWALDWFWGGRPMTGYHAWVFPFVLAFFHLPMLTAARWSVRLQARALASSAIFWIVEDAIWFVVNPAFGWSSLTPERVWWHKRWLFGLPLDYWTFGLVGGALLWWSFSAFRCLRQPPPAAVVTSSTLPPQT